eukprot:UN02708
MENHAILYIKSYSPSANFWCFKEGGYKFSRDFTPGTCILTTHFRTSVEKYA